MVTDIFFDLQRFNVNDDAQRWNQIGTVGGATDTVTVNHAEAYNDFYDLETGNASDYSVAYYSNMDSLPTETGGSDSVVVISGNTVLADATHVTLSVGAGAAPVPLHIAQNENSEVVDVTLDLTAASSKASVAIGYNTAVNANHEVSLGANGGYVYLGAGASGQNKVFAGAAGAQIRHDGTARASIFGGSGNDTIMPGINDVVKGGGGADLFYDTRSYTIQDYNAVTEGDAIIAVGRDSLEDITYDNISSSSNTINFGLGDIAIGNDPNAAIYAKVAVIDTDGNVGNARINVVLAGNNGVVDASAVTTDGGALIISNSARGNSVHTITGTASNDTIYAGKNDLVMGSGGNDSITVDAAAAGEGGAVIAIGEGHNTISGWTQGFDQNVGATKLYVGSAQARGRFFEDRLFVSLEGGSADNYMLFEDTANLTATDATHGQFDVLLGTDSGNEKLTAIRTEGYASVSSNDNVADYYIAERDGVVIFDQGVTEDFTGGDHAPIILGSNSYQGVRTLSLNNNSKAVVIGSDARETVYAGGLAAVGANKVISMGGGDDVIISGGDDSLTAGHTFVFGANDGRDTIQSFGHYLGVDVDPDKQYADTLYLERYDGLRVEQHESGYRIEFNTGDDSHVVVYEDSIDTAKKYQVQIAGYDTKLTEIGYSDILNTFEYDKKVSYYVGSSGEARDILHVADTVENANIRLDGATGDYYRGIGIVNASEDTYTNISLGGGAQNNTLIAGGTGSTTFLWGGAGDNLLSGGNGIDYFLYYKNANHLVAGGDTSRGGNNDVIANYNENQDFIYLANVTIDDINTAAMMQRDNLGITENAVTVDFKDGGSLTVNVASTNDKISFWMQDGSVYSANRSTGGWSQDKTPGPLPG